jgi:membrane-associated phospholipid phosphatase
MAIGMALVGAGLALRWALEAFGPLPLDRAPATVVEHVKTTPASAEVLQFFSATGGAVIAAFVVLSSAVVVGRRLGRRCAALVLLAALALPLVTALRGAWATTPGFGDLVYPEGSNYPSRHAVFFAAVLGPLTWMAWRRRAFDAALILLLVVLLGGLSRVLSGAHLPSDVVGGYLFGAGWAVLVGGALGLRPRQGRR